MCASGTGIPTGHKSARPIYFWRRDEITIPSPLFGPNHLAGGADPRSVDSPIWCSYSDSNRDAQGQQFLKLPCMSFHHRSKNCAAPVIVSNDPSLLLHSRVPPKGPALIEDLRSFHLGVLCTDCNFGRQGGIRTHKRHVLSVSGKPVPVTCP